MDILPAIDLLDGRAVRLRQGRYDAVTSYGDDPVLLAQRWSGAVPRIHVVDLEGARAGSAVQRDLVLAIVRAFSGKVQAGGGVRSLDAVESYLALGVERVVLGTAAIQDPALVTTAARAFPGRVVVALDAHDGLVATQGWVSTSDKSVHALARELDRLPLAALLYTDIARDGTEVGPNLVTTAELANTSSHPVIASGGVGTLAHLTALRAASPRITAVVVGRALHEARFTLAEAVAAGAGEPLLPAATQDKAP